MLLGEYAVLHGKHAVVCAVDKRMTVTITPRQDNKISIASSLGTHATTLSTLKVIAPFQFVLMTLKKFKKQLPSGCDIHITAEFSEKIGFGSSAAVTVATVAAIAAWLNLKIEKLDLIRIARTIVRAVQGLGSGADVAACVMGGMVLYRAQPLRAEKLPHTYPLVVVYSGSKTPTVDAVNFVKQAFAAFPHVFKQICLAIDVCAVQGSLAISQQNWAELGKIMNIQQGLMDALGVNTHELHSIVYTLRTQPHILGAKISGSGLGDCAIGLGKLTDEVQNELSVRVSERGVVCE